VTRMCVWCAHLLRRQQVGMFDSSSQDDDNQDVHDEVSSAAAGACESTSSAGEELAGDDATLGIDLPLGRQQHATAQPPMSLSAEPLRPRDMPIHVSNVTVTRAEAAAILRMYPFKGGARYVLPSQPALARARLKQHRMQEAARQQARQGAVERLFGEAGAAVLPAFLRNVSIDDDTADKVVPRTSSTSTCHPVLASNARLCRCCSACMKSCSRAATCVGRRVAAQTRWRTSKRAR